MTVGHEALRGIDRRNQAIKAMVAVFLALILFVVGSTAWGVYSQGRQLVAIGVEQQAQANLLIDCTTPSAPGEPHECWDRLRSGDSGTSDAVRRLYCIPLVLAGYLPPECSDVADVVAGLPRP